MEERPSLSCRRMMTFPVSCETLVMSTGFGRYRKLISELARTVCKRKVFLQRRFHKVETALLCCPLITTSSSVDHELCQR